MIDDFTVTEYHLHLTGKHTPPTSRHCCQFQIQSGSGGGKGRLRNPVTSCEAGFLLKISRALHEVAFVCLRLIRCGVAGL